LDTPAGPSSIEKKSFEIIDSLVDLSGISGNEAAVVRRVVHATADPEFARTMLFSDGAVEAGIEALKSGCTIVTDVRMLQAGISRGSGKGPGRETACYISDQDVAEDAGRAGTTRAAAAMRKAHRLGVLDGAVVVIGNAPTALFELMRLVREEGARPALIVGVPVGFVGAAESKDELAGFDGAPFITNSGNKGGSPVGAAAVNAMIRLADVRPGSG